MKINCFLFTILILIMTACNSKNAEEPQSENQNVYTGARGEVKIMTLDPGHFHAALVQKTSYEQVDSKVYVFAPDGDDLKEHLKRIDGFNNRAENPTHWEEKIYSGDDFFEKMLAEKPGNVMVTAGNNAKKTEYIYKTIEAGINVLADKPMVIKPEEFTKLEQAFELAEKNGVLLYDIMTERYEITTIIQRELSKISEVFGELKKGTLAEPAITKESVHHLFKYVSGNPLIRPKWFFDVNQQGQGMVDVGTHLVDLIQWEAFPEIILSKDDIEIISAKKWSTDLTSEMFKKVTEADDFPDYLQKNVQDNVLKYECNGEINYKIKGVNAKVSVIWNFEAPEGTGDTHYSIMRGSKCNLIIKQGAEENFMPTLYIIAKSEDIDEFASALETAIKQGINPKYPDISIKKTGDKNWIVDIPEKYKVGHEAHFTQVTEKYLQYLVDGKLPVWEIPNMIVKYYTTSEALKKASE